MKRFVPQPSTTIGNLALDNTPLLVRSVDARHAGSVALLQQQLYPHITAEGILARQKEPFRPEKGAEKYRTFCLVNPNDEVISTGHLKLRHNTDSQSRPLIVEEDGQYAKRCFGDLHPTPYHELEIGGAVLNPAYQGNGLGKVLMRALTDIALETPHTVTRVAKGPYGPTELSFAPGTKPGEKFTLPQVQDASKASCQVAAEYGMSLAGASMNYGGPMFYLPGEGN